jgi:lipid-A-disaccharide synthase-like uncharacterized protein
VARKRAWIPESAFFAIWSSSAFLFYLGAFVALSSILWLLESLNGSGGDDGIVVWATLALASLVATALLLQRAEQRVLAGLAAFCALIVFAVWVGSILDWSGVSPDETNAFFHADFDPAFLVLEALVVAAGLVALSVFRFPLLLLPVALVAWYGLVDNAALLVGETGNDAHAVLSIGVGLLLVAAGIWLDRNERKAYAFWSHVVGGVAVAGGILELLGNDDWSWALGGAVALAYIAVAALLARSSYAVIGAIGVLVVGNHFIEQWYSSLSIPFLLEASGNSAEWKGPVSYIVLGLILVVLGVLVERVRRLRPQ